MTTDAITVTIGGVAHHTWVRYRIDSDLITPADAWEVELGDASGAPLPEAVKKGAEAQITLDKAVLLTGAVDTIRDRTDKYGRQITIDGRDIGARLLDCSVPFSNMTNATVAQIVKKIVAPLGITRIEWRARAASDIRKKIHVEPGQNAWDALLAACEANHVWPWFDSDGTLVIGQPDYTTPVVTTLYLDGDKTNVIALERMESQTEEYEEIVVYGQAAGDGEEGHHVVGRARGTLQLKGYVRRRIAVDGNCESTQLATARASKLVADGRMSGDKVTISVQGHRTPDGRIWTPGMRVAIKCPQKRIDAVYFLVGRALSKNRSEGTTTELRFIPDGSWVLNVPYIAAVRRNDYH